MTIVTITIDDPNGADSNQLFPSAFPYTTFGITVATGNVSGGVFFHRMANGVADTSRHYGLRGTGGNIAQTGYNDVGGTFNALTFTVQTAPGTPETQLMHVDFAFSGVWVGFGGVPLPSLFGLTADVLMGRIAQGSTDNVLVINGNVGSDTLRGSFFDDVLRGGAGADRLFGGDGVDTASYDTSNLGVTVNLATGAVSGGHAAGDQLFSIENVTGSNFNDVLTGDAGNNFFDGGLGFDVIDGGAGDDFIFGRDGGGTLRGGAGNDRVDGGVQNDTIYGGIGNDELRVGDGDNYAYGEDGNDTLLGASGIDRLYGGAGVDTLNGVSGNDILDGGAGADTMYGGTGASYYYVDNAGDVVNDFAVGDGDRVFTTVSYTLGGSSQIEFLSTIDQTATAAINLTGNQFAQTIYGNAGNNILDGKGGADAMVGRAGNDFFYVDSAGDTVNDGVGEGTADRVFASVNYALGAAANIEILSTTTTAGTGAINLTGNALAQTVYGNNGANIINGGAGNDTLQGFGGADTYLFNTALNAATNVDTIVGYSISQNVIQLENAVFAGLANGALSAGAFRIGAAAADADDRVIYNNATGALIFDSNGSAAGGATQFAKLAAGLAMTAGEFFVI